MLVKVAIIVSFSGLLLLGCSQPDDDFFSYSKSTTGSLSISESFGPNGEHFEGTLDVYTRGDHDNAKIHYRQKDIDYNGEVVTDNQSQQFEGRGFMK
jgi:hypothetical protein